MSDIRAGTISDAAGTGPITMTKQSPAKAWVNFNGVGTVAIRDSFNVASITDVATGVQEVNYTNNFANVGYAACASSTAGGATHFTTNVYTNSTVRTTTSGSSGNASDAGIVTVAANGDLA